VTVASIFLLTGVSWAEIPQKVTVQKVNVYGSSGSFSSRVDTGATNAEIKNGKLYMQGAMYEGQWQVRVTGIEYNLNFWNVGEEGGKKGMLFWEKDYGLATLTFSYNFDGPGKIVKKGPEFEGLASFQFEDASKEPEIELTYRFKFSGGPHGTFEEISPYVSPAGPARGRVIDGKLVSFDFPYDERAKYPYGIFTNQLDMPWKIPGDPFYGYDMDSTGSCGEYIARTNGSKLSSFIIPAANAQDSGARFTDFFGEVTVAPSSDPYNESPAELDMILSVGDYIRTQEESCAIISFGDMTTFILQPNTTVIMDSPPGKKSSWSILGGKIWANVGKIAQDGTMDVKMNQAVAGIKGTTFVLEETGDRSVIKVIEGKVEFTSLADNSKVLVESGSTISATLEGLSEQATFDVGAEKNKWKNLENSLLASNKTEKDANLSVDSSGFNRWYLLLAITVVIVVWLMVKKKK